MTICPLLTIYNGVFSSTFWQCPIIFFCKIISKIEKLKLYFLIHKTKWESENFRKIDFVTKWKIDCTVKSWRQGLHIYSATEKKKLIQKLYFVRTLHVALFTLLCNHRFSLKWRMTYLLRVGALPCFIYTPPPQFPSHRVFGI